MAGRPTRERKRPSTYEPADWRQGGRKKAKKRPTMDLSTAFSYADAAPQVHFPALTARVVYSSLPLFTHGRMLGSVAGSNAFPRPYH
jgi:hypothetical protein